MSSEQDLIDAIQAGVTSQDGRRLAECVLQAEQELLVAGRFSDSLFTACLTQLRRPEWVSMTDAFQLLRVFESNLDLLDAGQRARLAAALEESYGDLQDPTACLLAVELIADALRDAAALATLMRLRRVPAEMPRALVAHGFNWLARNADDAQLVDACRRELEVMSRDDSPVVRAEAVAERARLDGADKRRREGG
jgi:hypothetical protein